MTEMKSNRCMYNAKLQEFLYQPPGVVRDEIVDAFLAAGKMQTRGDVNIHVEVNGAENPEEWGKRLVRQMKLEMRTV